MKNWNYIEGAKTGNEKAISSTFHINDYGVEVGQWSWDWRGKAPDENKKKEIEQKIKSYVQQINKNVPSGDSDERDAVFSQLDKFVRAQGLNKKTGNALKYTNLEEAKKMCRQMNDSLAPDAALRHYRHVYEKDGAYYVMETGEADAKGMKRVGNDTPAEYFSKKPKVIGNEKTGAEGFFKQLSDDVKDREKKDDEEIKLVGNETYQHKLYPDKYVIIEGKNYKIVTDGKVEKSGELTDAVLYGINQTYKKVGNATYDMTERDYENEYKSLVQKRNNLQKGTKEYEEVQKRLDEIRKKLGRSPFGNKIGNDISGLGLKKGDTVKVKSGMWSGEKGKITGIHVSAKDQTLEVEVKLDNGGYVVDDQKQFVKIGNSASDDKFAYVMREFDEGKLKTPDGKVVTDPAQAKAIAYSESKKTENGLDRARKAMNKKNPDGLRLKIQDYAGQGLSYQDIVNQLIRFGYDKSDIEAQKEYIKSLIKE